MITLEEVKDRLSWEPRMIPAPMPNDWQRWADGKAVDIIEDEKSSVLLRDNIVLSRVSSKYHPFLNADLVALAEQATDEGWGVDSVLEFNHGRSVVVNLYDTTMLHGDHQLLLALVNSFTGKEALRLLPVNRRIVCRNQLPYYAGQRSYRHPHSKAVEFPHGMFSTIRADLNSRQAQMMEFKDIPVNFSKYVEQLLDNMHGAEAEQKFLDKRREQLMTAYEHPTAPQKGSAYAALQAVILADEQIIGRRGWRTVYGSEMSQLGLELLESEYV